MLDFYLLQLIFCLTMLGDFDRMTIPDKEIKCKCWERDQFPPEIDNLHISHNASGKYTGTCDVTQ